MNEESAWHCLRRLCGFSELLGYKCTDAISEIPLGELTTKKEKDDKRVTHTVGYLGIKPLVYILGSNHLTGFSEQIRSVSWF